MSRDRSASFLASLAALVLSAASASAADIYTKAPIASRPALVAPDYSWTGWYLGGAVGYSSGRVTLGSPAPGGAGFLRPSGFVGLVHAGYDYQFPSRFVLGGRIIAPIFHISDTTTAAGFPNTAKVKGAVLFAGRLGYAMGSYLPYAVAGLVWGRGESSSPFAVISQDHSGYVVGLGFEYRWLPNWSIDANYTFVSMEKATYNFIPFGGGLAIRGFDSHNFTIGLNWRPAGI
jgi:high affinity Mn2+ porin